MSKVKKTVYCGGCVKYGTTFCVSKYKVRRMYDKACKAFIQDTYIKDNGFDRFG